IWSTAGSLVTGRNTSTKRQSDLSIVRALLSHWNRFGETSFRSLSNTFVHAVKRIINAGDTQAAPRIVKRRHPFKAGVVLNPGANAFHLGRVECRRHELLLHDPRYDSSDEGSRKTRAAGLLQPWNQFPCCASGIERCRESSVKKTDAADSSSQIDDVVALLARRGDCHSGAIGREARYRVSGDARRIQKPK